MNEAFKSLDFTGKVLFVCGGARNMGAEICKIGAARGAKVVISDIIDEAGEKTAANIRKNGGEAYYIHCDVTKEDCKNAIDFTVEKFGRLDIACNNQAYFKFIDEIHNFPVDEFDRHMKVNVYGTFYLMKYELAQMVKQGDGGAVTNTGSTCGVVSTALMSAYVGSKHAVVGTPKTAKTA